ncbi:hypothetical protein BKI49_15055 [Streptomyces sp. Tue6028]|uniref:hypothetical protein n=1 Tax=Streptomyces sp. Tue6028 TaxID=2036037 RepID=UPI000BB39E55|nr:hypothetical protein [Streptomyces sp. Tue6028]PBC63246.1 hypothetical protein BKI49_15055 [Streptomyces sp. Tue6028]
MQGHGQAQPVKSPPPTGWLVFLRVFFVVISVFTLGLLAWTMMLRLAIVTRKSVDWGLFVASIAALVLSLVLLGTEPGEEVHTPGGWTGMALLLGSLVAEIAYYLAADIRHFHQLRFPGYVPHQPPPQAYGYPQSPYTATTVPQTQGPHTPPPMPRPTPPPATTAPPQRHAPARIDQVRAELDELSDYLRKHDGHQDDGRDGRDRG